MNYQNQKELIQKNIVPHLSGKIFISENAIFLSQTDTLKLFRDLKEELAEDNYFLREELRINYMEQVKKIMNTKIIHLNFH